MRDVADIVRSIDEQSLEPWVVDRRWFGSKSREVAAVHVADAIALRTAEPFGAIALVEVRFQPGTHEIYQLPLGLRRDDEGWQDGAFAHVEGWTIYDALADSALAAELVRLMVRSEVIEIAGESEVQFCSLDAPIADVRQARSIGAEQSNSSVVFDETYILKTYRRVDAGVNPELELLRFLTARDFPNVPRLHGWYSYTGRLMDATLGILQEFARCAPRRSRRLLPRGAAAR
jgi:predicted trehalose synthase